MVSTREQVGDAGGTMGNVRDCSSQGIGWRKDRRVKGSKRRRARDGGRGAAEETMSRGANGTKGVNRKGQKEDVVSKKITRNGRGSRSDASSIC